MTLVLSLALVFSLLTSAGPSVISGQNPKPKPAPTPTKPAKPTAPEPSEIEVIRTTTNLVQVDAVVLDSEGKPVTDLKAGEFEIVEGDRTHNATFSSYIDVTEEIPNKRGLDGRLARNELRRTFVFLVSLPVINFSFSVSSANGVRSGNRSNISSVLRDVVPTTQFLEKFVSTEMSERDLVAIANSEFDLGVLSRFTNDRNALHAAIEEIRENATKDKPTRVDIVNGQASTQGLVQQSLQTLEMLKGAVDQVKSLPGRKLVVLVSRGLFVNLYAPGAEVVRQRMREVIEFANRARVSFYALNPRGLGLGDNDSLIDITRGTGGEAIYNTNDLSVGFDRVLKENRGYYLLAYDPGSEASEKPHKLSVRVKRPGLHVRSRQSAYSTPTQSATTPVEDLTNALDSTFSVRSVPLVLTPMFLSPDGLEWRIVVGMEVDTKAIEVADLEKDLRTSTFTWAMQVIGPDNKLVSSEAKKISIPRDPTDTKPGTNGIWSYKFITPASRPGYYLIRAAVRDENSGRLGNSSTLIKVPELSKGHVSASSLVLLSTEAGNTVRTGAESVAVVQTQRVFKQGSSARYWCGIYDSSGEKDKHQRSIEARATIFQGASAVLISGQLSRTYEPSRMIPLSGDIALSSLPPGAYTLLLEIVSSARRKDRIERRVTFEIQ